MSGTATLQGTGPILFLASGVAVLLQRARSESDKNAGESRSIPA